MRKIIGTGETIMDILFKENKPVAAVPGGSAFNSIISVGRSGVKACFVGDTGKDVPGLQIQRFLEENGVDATHFHAREDSKTAISLAYLNENNDANYVFYKDVPTPNPHYSMPEIKKDDVVLFGSYYAICPNVHKQVEQLLDTAHNNGAILYYDLNFRRSHRHELDTLLPTIHQNFKLCTIVRGSADDFEIMFDCRDAEEIYRQHIAPYCPLFICTDGDKGITLCTPQGIHTYSVPKIQTVSNVGAGDNFNAGFAYGLIKNGVTREQLHQPNPEMWETLMDCGRRFAAEVCTSIDNYISRDFAVGLK